MLVCGVVGCSFTSGVSTELVTDDAATGIHSDSARSVDAVRKTDAAKKPVDAPPDAPPVPPSFVQGEVSTAMTNVASIAVEFTDPEVEGDLNLVAMYLMPGASLPTVTDSDHNTYTQVGTAVSTSDPGLLAVYAAADVVGGSSNTVTATFSGNETAGMAIVAYRGLATSSPIDVTVAATGTGTEVDSGTATTTHARDLLVGLAYVENSITAPGSGFTTRTTQNGNTIEDMFVTSLGSYDASATQAAGGYAMRLIALHSAQ